MYIPLGGTKNVAVATILIFTFVALWHGVAFHLLAWGWIVSLFILPELLAAYFLPNSKVRLDHVGLCEGSPSLTFTVRELSVVPPCLRHRGRIQYTHDDDGQSRGVRGWNGGGTLHGQPNHN